MQVFALMKWNDVQLEVNFWYPVTMFMMIRLHHLCNMYNPYTVQRFFI